VHSGQGLRSDGHVCDFHYRQSIIFTRKGCYVDAMVSAERDWYVFSENVKYHQNGVIRGRVVVMTAIVSLGCVVPTARERVCKSKYKRTQMFVPLGGLDYSLNELCPCDTGLECLKLKTKHKRFVSMFF